MIKYFKDSKGNKYAVDFYGILGKTINLSLQSDWSYRSMKLKVYYRPERTWDDHMGNTPCGYYVNIPLPTGSKKRVYIY